jgi:predicted ATPase/class 3 adenylate cyclase
MQVFTFLYTDIEGSTRLWEQYPQVVEAAIARHDRILRQAIGDHGGSVFRMVGDGLCAVFLNASNAVAAALQAQLALNAESWGETGPLKVRIAILTGEAEAQGGDYSGSSLNRIARLLGVTHGGQTVISQATQLLVRDALPPRSGLLDLGEVRLRDLSHPERVFQLVYPDLPAEFPALASLDRRPSNLPSPPTSLVGRGAELAEILTHLRSEAVRMLTLTGPGGMGKTRLGLEAAANLLDSFEHGVFFVDLASIRAPEAVAPAIANTLGIRETNYRPVIEELNSKLKDQEMLLLLDNMEQVTSAGPLLVELLGDCPRLKMLVTSREALHVRGEQIYPVPPLSLPVGDFKRPSLELLTQYEAVRLFIERARAVRPDFQVTNENAPAVAEICVRLDGLPLAIELAASRIRLFSPQALLERLQNRLSVLKGGARDLPTRQQTLRDTIGWSYDLLEPDGQCLFELLAVFPGGGTFDSIEAVSSNVERLAGMGLDTFEGLSSLVDKSLLRQVSEEGGELRFVMLETIREYASERLEQDPAFKAGAQLAHARYFAAFIEKRWQQLTGERAGPALQELTAEIENLRLAWRYWTAEGDLEKLDKFFDSLWLLYDIRGWYQAMINLTTDLLNVLTSTPASPERAQQEIVLQTRLASALQLTQGYVSTEVERAYTRALQLIEEQGEIPQLFPVLRGLSRYYSYRSEYEKAIRLGEYILNLAEQLDDEDMRVIGHLTLGTNYSFSKDLNLGLGHLNKGIALYVPHRRSYSRYGFGADPGVACYITSCMILWMLGFPDQALQRASETVSLTKELNHPFSRAYALFHSGLLNLWTGEIERAEEHAHQLNVVVEDYDFAIWKAVGSCLHGAALAGLGRHDQGLEQIRWGMEVYQGLNTPPIFWPMLVFNQAQACLLAGRAQEGLEALSDIMKPEDASREDALMCEFYRLAGNLLLAISGENATQAEAFYQKAVETGRRHQARFLVLRAALCLARLWKQQDRGEQARQMLSEAYAAMSEGFETPDMLAAREFITSSPDNNRS